MTETDSTPSPKRAKTMATKTEKDKKEDDRVKHIIIHMTRSEFNDVVLVCKGEKEGYSVHFYVERAVLACVSSPFSNMLTDCKNDKDNVKPEIALNEDASTVETFLNIVYGKCDLSAFDSFHHIFMVLEMGDKFCTTFIVDRMIFQLCENLRTHVEGQKPFTTRYSNAVILKLLSLCRKIKIKQVIATQLAFNTLKSTILRYWHQYLKKCGAKFLGKCACSCGNCECTSKFCMINQSFDTSFSQLAVSIFFTDQDSAEYFSALDILLFTNALNNYFYNGGDAEKALIEFFSPHPQKGPNNTISPLTNVTE